MTAAADGVPPGSGCPSGKGAAMVNEMPVSVVDWCDAHAFCKRAPYGEDHAADTCNDGHLQDQQRRERVGSNVNCTGGYAGIVDMSGNVEEWVNARAAPGADAAAADTRTRAIAGSEDAKAASAAARRREPSGWGTDVPAKGRSLLGKYWILRDAHIGVQCAAQRA